MNEWLDSAGRCFNPNPRVSVLPLTAGQVCVVVDEVLANPDGLVAWARMSLDGLFTCTRNTSEIFAPCGVFVLHAARR